MTSGAQGPAARRPTVSRRRLAAAGTAVLVATGGVASQALATGRGQDSESTATRAAGTWQTVAAMGTPRVFHTATLLHEGAVLVTGGQSQDTDSPALSTTEIYSPWTNTWRPAAPMHVARSRHTATMLPNNRVFVAGNGTAEIYTPWTNSWRTVAPPRQLRDGATATMLYDGRILVMGNGSAKAIEESPEIYDYMKNTWTTLDTPEYAPGGICGSHMTSSEPAGAVVAGGCGFFGGSLSGAAEFAPTTDTWETVDGPKGVTGDESSAATVLDNDSILVSGGWCLICDTVKAASIYSPRTQKWTRTGDMLYPRRLHTLTTLDNGDVLAVGDFAREAAASRPEVYRPDAGTWQPAGVTTVPRAGHTATLLKDDRVLVTGGIPALFERPTDSAEAFRLARG
jgi:Kelch motif